MDLVTVTATIDKDMFLLQAHSLNLFVEHPVTHWIIIEDDALTEEEWLNSIRPIYNRHKFNLIYNPVSKDKFSSIGYLRQQVFKFTVSEFIENDYYIIIDSKNICIRQTDFCKIPSEGNHTILLKEDYKFSIYYNWIIFLEIYLNKKLPDSVWSPETPFKMNTAITQNIVKTFDLTQVFAYDIRPSHSTEISEFIFYRYFTDEVPKLRYGINKTFWNSLPSIAELETLLINEPECTMIGLHRSVIHTDFKKINDIVDWLITHGLDEKYINFLRK